MVGKNCTPRQLELSEGLVTNIDVYLEFFALLVAYQVKSSNLAWSVVGEEVEWLFDHST